MMAYDVQYAPEKPHILKGAAVLGLLAFAAFSFLSKRFIRDAKRDLAERYPAAEITEMQKTGFPLPNGLKFTCCDSEYDMVFEQCYSRAGLRPSADDPDEKGYPARAAARTACLMQISALSMPENVQHTVLRYPNDTGLTVFTDGASQEEVASLLEAMQPEKIQEPLPYTIGICSPELYQMFAEADYTAMYHDPTLALNSIGGDGCMTFVYAFPLKRMSGDMPDEYDPAYLESYTSALEADPAHSIVELSGVLGTEKTEIRLIQIEDPMY